MGVNLLRGLHGLGDVDDFNVVRGEFFHRLRTAASTLLEHVPHHLLTLRDRRMTGHDATLGHLLAEQLEVLLSYFQEFGRSLSMIMAVWAAQSG